MNDAVVMCMRYCIGDASHHFRDIVTIATAGIGRGRAECCSLDGLIALPRSLKANRVGDPIRKRSWFVHEGAVLFRVEIGHSRAAAVGQFTRAGNGFR